MQKWHEQAFDEDYFLEKGKMSDLKYHGKKKLPKQKDIGQLQIIEEYAEPEKK